MATKKPAVKKAPVKRGRPTLYNDKIVNEFFDRYENGENIASICKDNHMPKWSTIWAWENEDTEVNGLMVPRFPEFRDRFARARVMNAEYGVHESQDIADTIGTPWVTDKGKTVKGEDGKVIMLVTNEETNKAKVRIGVRQWTAERVHLRYKPKATMEQTGPNGGPLQSVNVNAATNVAELEAAVKSLLEKGV